MTAVAAWSDASLLAVFVGIPAVLGYALGRWAAVLPAIAAFIVTGAIYFAHGPEGSGPYGGDVDPDELARLGMFVASGAGIAACAAGVAVRRAWRRSGREQSRRR